MPRPWEDEKYKELSKNELEEKFGPEVAKDGTTREQFFDKMVEMGWNLEKDEEAIVRIYIHAAAHVSKQDCKNPNLLKEIMNTPLGDKTPYKDRFDIVTKTLRHRIRCDTGFSHPFGKIQWRKSDYRYYQ